MKKDYIPNRDGDLDNWEDNFKTNIDAIATALGIPAPDVTALKAKITGHQGKYDASVTAQAAAKSAVNTAHTARKDTITDIRKMANRLKAAPLYTNAQGITLKIIGEDSTFDPATAKPKVKLSLQGGNVIIEFNNPAEVDGVKIFSKRAGETEFSFLTIDTSSPYEDNRDNLTPGTAEERKYYVFFFDDDRVIGLQSDEVSISITR
ncbi:MAG: hypothetical protein JJE25_12255 [Bacteroidia bacterium]|nr:hypothetical protein [Bacteroidia bacterium]